MVALLSVQDPVRQRSLACRGIGRYVAAAKKLVRAVATTGNRLVKRLVITVRVMQSVGDPVAATDLLVADGLVPLLDQLDAVPSVACTLSAGVSFWEQVARNFPDVADRIATAIRTGAIEPLGGPIFDTVLAGIPRRDRIGQVAAYGDWAEAHWGLRPSCGWVPHQVWEPSMADDLVEAGLTSVVLLPDLAAATRSSHPVRSGWFLTESDGRLLQVLPADETLAGLIADDRIDDVPGWLQRHAEAIGSGPVVVTGKLTARDPRGKQLARLLKWLTAESDWSLVTASDALEETVPCGRFSLPTVGKPGGNWRLERDCDSTATRLHARLLDVSRRIDSVVVDSVDQEEAVTTARLALYRAQGAVASGPTGVASPAALGLAEGLLLVSERAADRIEGRRGSWVDVSSEDFDLDGRPEIRLQSDRLTAWIDPTGGRGLFSIELRDTGQMLEVASLDGASGGLTAWLLEPGTELKAFLCGTGRETLLACRGCPELVRQEGAAWLQWTRTDDEPAPRLAWRIGMETGRSGRLLLEGRIEGLVPGQPGNLAVELPLGTGADGEDRYLYDQRGRRWDIDSTTELCVGERVGIAEENAGVDSSIEWQPVAAAWRVRGLSTELVIPRWEFQADENGEWSFQVQLSIDTSAAQARQLAGLAFPARRVA